MPALAARHLPMIAAALAMAGAAGCARTTTHTGYIADQVLVDSIQPGVDNRASVENTLGRPTFASQFNQGGEAPVWYYVSRDTRHLAIARPNPVAQDILAVRFDGQGNVASVGHIGLDQVASIDPYGEETPTLGSDRGFFAELFGNIGQVGAVGEAGTTADNPGGN